MASGHELGAEEIGTLMEDARSGLSTQLQSFTHNTTEFLRREQELLLHGQGVPQTRTVIERPTRSSWSSAATTTARTCAGSSGSSASSGPVLVGVDAGADALIAAGHRPDIVVVGEDGPGPGQPGGRPGQPRSPTRRCVRRGRSSCTPTAPGARIGGDRLDRLGVRHQTLSASGTSEDVALLLADVRGASLIIAVGTHATLDEFLDRQRSGLASTFLTRLRVGPKLVDAKGVPQLYAGRVRLWHLALVLLAGLARPRASRSPRRPVGDDWWSSIGGALSDVLDWIQGLFT